ncbi:MAG TPA: hypothetical protein VFO85_00615, partial [Vicinamibacteria bacterium]|nr:hypothetical protein [Vicinamibacteria bacterium]
MPDTRLAESVPADAAPSAGVRAQGPRRLRDALLAAIVLVLAAYWALFHGLPPGPAFSSFAADPEMAYFLSSLGPFKGVGYAYVHHPGTPVQLLGTTLLALSYPFLRGAEGGFVLAHVRHPHVFFLMAHALLGLAGAAGVVAVGTRALAVRHGRDALCAAGLAASFHALSPLGLATTVYWSHNSFSFPFATLLALAAVLALRRRPTLERRLLALLALAAGVLAATQLYLATCAVGLAVTAATAEWLHRRSWRSSLGAAALVAGATAAGFVLSTLPVLHLYPEMFA